MSSDDVMSQFAPSRRHTTHYLQAGPKDGRAVILVHGWPEISLAWRHQIVALSRLGFRVIAPDLRGCGRSMIYDTHAAYAQREIVHDMLDLADHLGIAKAHWVGHDWGSAVIWNIARHHADRCAGVASLCVPYDTLERGIERLSSLVNRVQYPAAQFPLGQFEYIAFYHEHFKDATASFDANVENLIKVIMRSADPLQAGKPFATAFVRQRGGWFGPGAAAPNVPLDRAILDDSDLASYVSAYAKSGFFGANSLYMNDRENDAYAREARTDSIDLPVIFLSGQNDFVCDTERSDLMLPMQSKCHNLTCNVISSGHWMQHERPSEVNAALSAWLTQSAMLAPVYRRPAMSQRPFDGAAHYARESCDVTRHVDKPNEPFVGLATFERELRSLLGNSTAFTRICSRGAKHSSRTHAERQIDSDAVSLPSCVQSSACTAGQRSSAKNVA